MLHVVDRRGYSREHFSAVSHDPGEDCDCLISQKSGWQGLMFLSSSLFNFPHLGLIEVLAWFLPQILWRTMG